MASPYRVGEPVIKPNAREKRKTLHATRTIKKTTVSTIKNINQNFSCLDPMPSDNKGSTKQGGTDCLTVCPGKDVVWGTPTVECLFGLDCQGCSLSIHCV
jgi:hypothetical protein